MSQKITHDRLVIPVDASPQEVLAMKVQHAAEALARPLYGYRMPRADFRAWMERKGNSFSLSWLTKHYDALEVEVYNILAQDGRIGFFNRPISRTDWQIAVLDQPYASVFSENERVKNLVTRANSVIAEGGTSRVLAAAGDVRISPHFQRVNDVTEDFVANHDRTRGRFEEIGSELIGEFFKAPLAVFPHR